MLTPILPFGIDSNTFQTILKELSDIVGVDNLSSDATFGALEGPDLIIWILLRVISLLTMGLFTDVCRGSRIISTQWCTIPWEIGYMELGL